ncbi:MAG: hypothetical protein E1N59_1868 [Puniceicoccaceae bacterium 5H]|nr:MAG: hypothetical protein E1N59_1868 [Puniceicoccaceae bacterium 5H]
MKNMRTLCLSLILCGTLLGCASLPKLPGPSGAVTVNQDTSNETALIARGASLREIVAEIEEASGLEIDIDAHVTNYRNLNLQLSRRDTWLQSLRDLAGILELRVVEVGENHYRLVH